MRAKTVLAIGIFLLALIIAVVTLLRQVAPVGQSPTGTYTSEDSRVIAATASLDHSPGLCTFLDDPAERATCIAKALPPPSIKTFSHHSQQILESATATTAVQNSEPGLCILIQDPELLKQCIQKAT